MKGKFLLLIFFIVSVATGCSNDAETTSPILQHETIGDLEYEVKLRNNRFRITEEIEAITRIKNLGNKDITYVSGSSSCPDRALVELIHQQSNTQLARKSRGDFTAEVYLCNL